MAVTDALLSSPGTTVATLTCCCAVVVFVVTLLKVTVGLWRTVRRNRTMAADFPAPPGGHWLLGHLVMAGPDGGELMLRGPGWAEDYKYAHLMHGGPLLTHCSVYHPDYVKAVMTRSDKKDEFAYSFLRPWLGDGLLTSAGPKWFRNRRLLTPGFHFEILKPYVRLFSESTNVMLDNWGELKPGSAIDVFHQVSLMTLDSMLKCTLSQNTNCQTRKTNDYISSIHELAELAVLRGRSVVYLLSDFLYSISSGGRRHKAACYRVHKYSEEIIRQRKEVLKEQSASGSTHGKKYLDFLDILLRAKDEDGNGLTDAEIRDEVDTFMFEGHDTTASGLSWTLYCLARHPGHQEKCRKEAQEVLKGKTEVTWDDLPSMKYITMCVKESLRMYPAVPEIFRDVETSVTFSDGRTLPEGSQVYIGLYHLHHSPHIWEKPEEFDPSRFSPENSKDRHPYAFLPFSAGPRNCIGQHFAMNELKTAVALILQRFSLTPDDTLPEPFPVHRMVLRADTPGLFLKIRPIEME
ncbi:CYP4F2 [Branchiostoma lanceolatum]|uniref:CYP4F2 protein n=1 Tax=Branchiostoma lanceolatum TaxID=7740 RepID=A0A8K0EUS6_BRALA|nr:CYP4F2 [Branchiostoma lanceolatum]